MAHHQILLDASDLLCTIGLVVYSLMYINLVQTGSRLHISAFYLNKEERIQFPSAANSAFYKSAQPGSDGCIAKTALRIFCWVLLLGDDQENFAIPAESFKKKKKVPVTSFILKRRGSGE